MTAEKTAAETKVPGTGHTGEQSRSANVQSPNLSLRYRDMSARLLAVCADEYPLTPESGKVRRELRVVPGHDGETFRPHVAETVMRIRRTRDLGAVVTDFATTTLEVRAGRVAGSYSKWIQKYDTSGEPVPGAHDNVTSREFDGDELTQVVDRLWGEVKNHTADVTPSEIVDANQTLDAILQNHQQLQAPQEPPASPRV